MWCGDPECDCWVPVILENQADGSTKELWRGQFLEHPTAAQKMAQRLSLKKEMDSRGDVILIGDITYAGK